MKTILLVEDNLHIQKINAQLIAMNGYGVVTASSAAEARGQLRHHQADLLIMDVMLPDGNGLDLCGELKALYHLPVIFVTAMSELSDITAGLCAGDDYVTKPYDLDDLIARIERLLPPETKETVLNIEGTEIKVIWKYNRMARKFIEHYPDLIENPIYTPKGERIMLAIEDACPHAVMVDDDPASVDCGSCVYFRQPSGSILGVCHNEKMRCVSAKQRNTSSNKEETL
jgi:CheY-like chemotaxis protein